MAEEVRHIPKLEMIHGIHHLGDGVALQTEHQIIYQNMIRFGKVFKLHLILIILEVDIMEQDSTTPMMKITTPPLDKEITILPQKGQVENL